MGDVFGQEEGSLGTQRTLGPLGVCELQFWGDIDTLGVGAERALGQD